MFSELITLEQSYNAQLPATRINKSPGEDLRAAARVWSDKVWEKALELGPVSLTSGQLEDGRRLIQHPVFICGVHRSGTTLVRDLLDSHPDLIVLPSEGTYYTNLEHKILALPESKRAAFLGKEWLRRLVNPTNQPPYWLLGRSSEDSSLYVEFARYVLSWWQIINDNKSSQSPQVVIMLAYASCMNHLDAKHWVDKTPGNEFFLRRIHSDFPNAKIIQLVRNPVDILASRKKSDPSFNLRNVLIHIRKSFKISKQKLKLSDPAHILIRYEALCQFPESNVRLLCQLIDIGISETLLTPSVAGFPATVNSSFEKKSASGQIHKWDRTHEDVILTRLEKQLLSACIGNVSAKLGYPLEKVDFFKQTYLRLKYFI